MTAYKVPQYQGQDDTPIPITRRDFSGGQNNRIEAQRMGENQLVKAINVDLGTPAQTSKRPGALLKANVSASTGLGLLGFEPDGGTNELLVVETTNLQGSTDLSSFSTYKSDFTTGLQTTILTVGMASQGDVALIGNGTDNWFIMEQDHTMVDLGSTAGTGNDSPPKSTVAVYHGNRLWIMKDGNMYFSDAYPADYATAFDTVSNAFRFSDIGAARALVSVRDLGIIAFGDRQVWGLNPSPIPDASTDIPGKILDIGCRAGNTAVQCGDDVLFLANDGVRGVFRTQQDKMTGGSAFPLSYGLKDETGSISWAYISKACAIFFDNKYFISLPVNSSSYNNQVWIYWPATQAWAVINGWNVAAFAKINIDGEQQLFYVDSVNGNILRAWTDLTDNDTSITMTLKGRKEDMGQPLIYKNGGEIEVEALVAGAGDGLRVEVSIDGGGDNVLGTVDLTLTTSPALPVYLPFYLADAYMIRKKFHLDDMGRWKTLQLTFTSIGGDTDPIVFFSYSIITFGEEYENE